MLWIWFTDTAQKGIRTHFKYYKGTQLMNAYSCRKLAHTLQLCSMILIFFISFIKTGEWPSEPLPRGWLSGQTGARDREKKVGTQHAEIIIYCSKLRVLVWLVATVIFLLFVLCTVHPHGKPSWQPLKFSCTYC